MRPLIADGSLVEIRPLVGTPRVGQVLAVFRGNRLIVHRLTQITSNGLILRGDGTLQADPAVVATDVLGRVLRVETPRGWRLRLDTVASQWVGRAIVGLGSLFRDG